MEPGEPWPIAEEGRVELRRVEFCRQGVPVVGLLIWSADAYAAWQQPNRRLVEQDAAEFGRA